MAFNGHYALCFRIHAFSEALCWRAQKNNNKRPDVSTHHCGISPPIPWWSWKEDLTQLWRGRETSYLYERDLRIGAALQCCPVFTRQYDRTPATGSMDWWLNLLFHFLFNFNNIVVVLVAIFVLQLLINLNLIIIITLQVRGHARKAGIRDLFVVFVGCRFQ